MKLIFTGGGTGGHLVIAQSLAIEAEARGHTVIFIGSTAGQDKKWFESSDVFDSTYFLDSTGVVNKRGFRKIIALSKVFINIFSSIKLIKKLQANAVISVGGYSAASTAIGSALLGTKLYIHEQNASTGRLNELLRNHANGFFSSYEVGNFHCDYPVKEEYFLNARIRTKISTIIFLGGSQGAKFINDVAISLAPWLCEQGIQIIHQCGTKDEEVLTQIYQDLKIDVKLFSFSKEISNFIKVSDFAVSRAGASTLWELTASQIPTFFIPYPRAAGDHQYHNAKFIVENGLGWCEREDTDMISKIKEAILSDISTKSTSLSNLISPNGAKKIIDFIENDAKKKNNSNPTY